MINEGVLVILSLAPSSFLFLSFEAVEEMKELIAVLIIDASHRERGLCWGQASDQCIFEFKHDSSVTPQVQIIKLMALEHSWLTV